MTELNPDRAQAAEAAWETEGLVLPDDRPDGYFAEGDEVVAFVPAGRGNRVLRAGVVDSFSAGGQRLTIRLDVPVPATFFHEGGYDAGQFSLGVREPFVMKRTEYEALFRDREGIKRWVAGAKDVNAQHLARFTSQLARVGVSGAKSSIGYGPSSYGS